MTNALPKIQMKKCAPRFYLASRKMTVQLRQPTRGGDQRNRPPGGRGASIETRILAAELAEEVTGVRGVVNRIEAPGAPSPARTVNLNLNNKTGNLNE